MNKDQLAQELREKLKEGIKPSDLKKPREKNSQTISTHGILTPLSTPPLKPTKEGNSPSPIVQLEREPNQATHRDESPVKNQDQTLIKQLQEQVQFWSNTAQIHLTNLQRTTAELDNTQTENQTLKQQIKKLQAQTTDKTYSKQANFTCSTCQQTLPQNLIRLIDQDQQTCRDCLNKMLAKANQLSGEEIVLKKKAEPSQPTFTCQTCQQTYLGEPHQVHVANFQGAGIIPQALTSVCSACLEERVSLANFYCPRTSEGKDTWDPKEPQFDCWCERREV